MRAEEVQVNKRPPRAALVHRQAERATDGRAKALEVKAPIGSMKSSEKKKKKKKGEDEDSIQQTDKKRCEITAVEMR